MNNTLKTLTGRIIQGHQVASGANQDPLFPGGTLAMQLPFFLSLGLDLNDFHLATLNTSIAPLDFEVVAPDWHFKAVKWHPTEPAEDFSFIEIRADAVDGLIYYPHPETKPAHHQPKGLIEIILKQYVDSLNYGESIELTISTDKIRLIEPT